VLVAFVRPLCDVRNGDVVSGTDGLVYPDRPLHFFSRLWQFDSVLGNFDSAMDDGMGQGDSNAACSSVSCVSRIQSLVRQTERDGENLKISLNTWRLSR
jgi:hypothetical protein